MAEYSKPPRARPGSSARERRFAQAFHVWGSGDKDLQGMAERSELEALLAIITVTFNTVTVNGTLIATTVNTTDLNVTGNASFANFTTDTITANTVNTATLNVSGSANFGSFSATSVNATTVTGTTVNATDLNVTGNTSFGELDATTIESSTVSANTLNVGSQQVTENTAKLFGQCVATEDATYNMTAPDAIVLVTTGATNTTVYLPQASLYVDTIVSVKKIDSGAGEITVQSAEVPAVETQRQYAVDDMFLNASGSREFQIGAVFFGGDAALGTSYDQIDGADSQTIANTQFATLTMVSDGTTWHILNSYTP